MLRSMFSAVSGLRAHQTMIDVTGNNIANVNTSGYKSTRATFREALTQVVRGGTGAVAPSDPDGAQGGVNPMQLGLGAVTGGVDGVFTQGATQTTGRALDVAIQGDGFLVVDGGEGNRFTRAGMLSLDAAGNMVGPGGELLQGWLAAPPAATTVTPDITTLETINIDTATYTDIAIAGDGTVTGRDASGLSVELGVIATARFANAGGLTRVGDGLYAEGANAGAPVVDQPGINGLGSLQAGTLEMSNVDLALEFTNLILAQRGFQSNARVITASDELLQELVNLKR